MSRCAPRSRAGSGWAGPRSPGSDAPRRPRRPSAPRLNSACRCRPQAAAARHAASLALSAAQIRSGRRRHVDRAHAALGERVKDGIDHRRQGAGDACLAATLDAQRVGGRRHRMIADRDRRDRLRARHRVVHERSADQLARAVVEGRLHQRLADALRDAAVHLAARQHRVDQHAEVVDRGVALQRRHAGLGIDLDLRDVRAVGKARRRRIRDQRDVQARPAGPAADRLPRASARRAPAARSRDRCRRPESCRRRT